jgi:hypothetical protein
MFYLCSNYVQVQKPKMYFLRKKMKEKAKRKKKNYVAAAVQYVCEFCQEKTCWIFVRFWFVIKNISSEWTGWTVDFLNAEDNEINI